MSNIGHEGNDGTTMTQEERNEYLLKHENFIRCARCKNLIHSSNKYCQYCGRKRGVKIVNKQNGYVESDGMDGRSESTKEILMRRISEQSQSSRHDFPEERVQSILLRNLSKFD